MPPFPTLSEPLTDGTVSVRLAAERDIPEVLIAYQDDPDLHLRMVEERPPTGAELGRRSERAEADRVAGIALAMTIAEAGDDTCRGQIYVHQADWDNGCAELAVWVSPERRGRRIARRALALVGEWLLRESALERVHLLTEPDNEAMVRAAKGAGFTYEGELRGYIMEGPRRIDAAVLSLVRSDLGS
jgi:RimJ/RimL family protein N-acetyltransferase